MLHYKEFTYSTRWMPQPIPFLDLTRDLKLDVIITLPKYININIRKTKNKQKTPTKPQKTSTNKKKHPNTQTTKQRNKQKKIQKTFRNFE